VLCRTNNVVTVPPGYVYPNGGSGSTNMLWQYQVYPYVKNTQIFTCPSDSYKWPGDYSGSITIGFQSYCSGVALGSFVNPSQCCLIADSGGSNPYNLSSDAQIQAGARHNDGGNVGFADGHGKWTSRQAYPLRSTTSMFWYPTYSGTNP